VQKHPIIASGATPSGALVTHPMNNYFEKKMDEENQEDKMKYFLQVALQD
jgi:hypothetical protein